jgi:hypothetical protein
MLEYGFRMMCRWLRLTPALLVTAGLTAEPERATSNSEGSLSGAAAEDWPQWRGPRGNGTWFGPALRDEWPAMGLPRRWRQPVGGGFSGVVVADGRVLTMDRKTEPREVERVLCFDAASGEPLWSHEYDVRYGQLDYGTGPRAAPTIVGDLVYTCGALGHLRCLNVATGELVWSRHLQKDFQGRLPMWGYAASPLIVGDRLIIQPGGDGGHSVAALNRHTGELIWCSHADQAGYTWPIVARAGGMEQLVCWTPSHIRGMELSSGKPLWEVPYEITYGVAIATPIFHRGLVVVCGYWHGSKAIRLGNTPADATLAWEENEFLRGLMSQPLCRGDHVYLLDKSFGLTCFEIANGRKLWDDDHQLTPRDRNPHVSLVWVGETERALCLNARGQLILARLTPERFEELARAKIIDDKSVIWAHPAYAGNCVYARSDEELVCVELPTE